MDIKKFWSEATKEGYTFIIGGSFALGLVASILFLLFYFLTKFMIIIVATISSLMLIGFLVMYAIVAIENAYRKRKEEE